MYHSLNQNAVHLDVRSYTKPVPDAVSQRPVRLLVRAFASRRTEATIGGVVSLVPDVYHVQRRPTQHRSMSGEPQGRDGFRRPVDPHDNLSSTAGGR
jgi:hypothetical protein